MIIMAFSVLYLLNLGILWWLMHLMSAVGLITSQSLRMQLLEQQTKKSTPG